MTVGQATQRRCTGCGRFLSTEAMQVGACTSCGTKVRAPAKGVAAAEVVTAPNPIVPEDATAVPIEPPPIGVAPTRPSASLSTRAIRPPRGVVIMRPSELHPDAPPPAVRRAPERAADEAPAPPAAPRPVPPAARAEPVAQPAPAPRPLQPARVEQAAPIAPAVQERTGSRSIGQGTSIMWWAVRIVVGVTIGILIGVAIPFLLSL